MVQLLMCVDGFDMSCTSYSRQPYCYQQHWFYNNQDVKQVQINRYVIKMQCNMYPYDRNASFIQSGY